jgi:hypothetical protein
MQPLKIDSTPANDVAATQEAPAPAVVKQPLPERVSAQPAPVRIKPKAEKIKPVRTRTGAKPLPNAAPDSISFF